MAQPDITPGDLATRARRRADMVGSNFVTPSELDGYIEHAWREFYMRMVGEHEDRFLRKAATPLTTVAGTSSYDLAADMLKFRGVRHRDDWFLGRIDIRELPQITTSGRRGKPTNYWLHGQLEGAVQLEVAPTPDAAYTLDYYYVPLLSLGDVIAGSLRVIAGFDEYIVLTAAIKMKDKEESDCSVLMAEKAQLWDLIQKAATPFDEAEPFAVVQSGSASRLSIQDDPFLLEDMMSYVG